MLRKLVRHVVFISIPLFVLLLITYHHHGHIEVQSNSSLENAQVNHHHYHQHHNHQTGITLMSNNVNDTAKNQWKVLHNGTVVHLGSQIIFRNISIVINNAQRCQSLKPNQTSFVVVVESNVVNFEERQLIRDTWGLDLMQNLVNYRVIFLVGLNQNQETQSKLDFENLNYQDIVQISVNEDFQNLTYKSVMMLYWYNTFCSNANYLYKTDDDIYLHLPNIIDLLNSVSLNGRLLCHLNKSRKILRNLGDIHHYFYTKTNMKRKEMLTLVKKKYRKYFIRFDKLPGSFYPDYCSGFSYIMDSKAAFKLYQVSQTIPYFGIEDVFITGFCRQKANLSIVNNVHFQLKPYIRPIESKCAFDDGRINSNEMDVNELKKLWWHVNTQGYYCKLTNVKNTNPIKTLDEKKEENESKETAG